MSLWESEKSCWHTKKGLFCATVCPSYLRFPVVSSPDIPRRPPSHQCPTQRKRLELNFSFLILRNWEMKRKSYLPSPSSKPFAFRILKPWVRTPHLENQRTFEFGHLSWRFGKHLLFHVLQTYSMFSNPRLQGSTICGALHRCSLSLGNFAWKLQIWKYIPESHQAKLSWF